MPTAKKACRFTVGTPQGRKQESFPVSRAGWKDAIALAKKRSRDDVNDINFSCGSDEPFGKRSLFLVTCASGFKDSSDPRETVCTTVYAQRPIHGQESPVLARRSRRRKRTKR